MKERKGMERLTSVKIKTGENSYSQQIPISVYADNVVCDSEKNLSEILGDLQTQINLLNTYLNQHNNDAAITALSNQLVAATTDINDHQYGSLRERLNSNFSYTANEIDKLNEFLLQLIKSSSVDYLKFTPGYYNNENGEIIESNNSGKFRIENITIPKINRGDCFYIKEPYQVQIYIYDSPDINNNAILIEKITDNYSSGIFFMPERYYGRYATVAIQKIGQSIDVEEIKDYVLYCSPKSSIDRAYNNLLTLTKLDDLNNVKQGVSYCDFSTDRKPQNAPTAKPIRIFTIRSEDENQNAVSQFGICDGTLYYRSKDWYSHEFSDWKSIGLGSPMYQDEQISSSVDEYYHKWQPPVNSQQLSQKNLGSVNGKPIYLYKLRLQRNSIILDNYQENLLPSNNENSLYKRPRILIISGVYGNEKSGPMNILKIAKLLLTREYNEIACKFDWYFIPILNSYGYDANQKLNKQGRDIELDWSDTLYTATSEIQYGFISPELQAIKNQVLEQIKPTVVIDLQQEDLSQLGSYCRASVPIDTLRMNDSKYADIINQIFTSLDIANANTDTTIAKWRFSNNNTGNQICKVFECPPTASSVNYFSGKIGNINHLSIKTPYSFIIKTDPICETYSQSQTKYNSIANTISLTYIWNIIKQIAKMTFVKDGEETPIITSLAILSDTNIINPTSDQVLAYNLETQKWINKDIQINNITNETTAIEIEVDNELSSTSTNPVQNKVIYQALEDKLDKDDVPTKLSDLENDMFIGLSPISNNENGEDEQLGTLFISEATEQTAGLMSAEDKVLLNDLSIKYDTILNGIDIEDNIVTNLNENMLQLPYVGEKVSLNILNKAKCYCELFKKTKCVVNNETDNSWQGMDIYGKYLFRSKVGGTVYVYDLSNSNSELNYIANFNFGSANSNNHAGVLSFTDIFLGTNEFPLLLVSDGSGGDSPQGYCYIEQITKNGNTFSSTLKVKITLNTSSFYRWTQWHYYNGYLYTFGHKTRSTGSVKTNKHILSKFSFPSLSLPNNSQITFTEDDILDQWEIDYQQNYMQGCRFYNDKIFATYGHGESSGYPNKIMIFSLVSHDVLASIDLSKESTLKDLVIEGCAIYNQKLLLGFEGSPNIFALTFTQVKADSIENTALVTQTSSGLMSAEDKIKLDSLYASDHYPPVGVYKDEVWHGGGSIVRSGKAVAFTIPVMGASLRKPEITINKIWARPLGVDQVELTPIKTQVKYSMVGINIVIEQSKVIRIVQNVPDTKPGPVGIQLSYNITFTK